jgi:flagellar motor switch protein FliM
MSNHLYKTYLPVCVEFGTAKISMQDLFDLRKGDIIKLDTKISDEHLVKIGNKTIFTGRTGILNDRKAIKITQKLVAPPMLGQTDKKQKQV